MELSSFRDLVLVIWGLIASVSILYLCIMVGVFYKRVNTFLSSMNEIADLAREEVIIPLSRIGSFLRGINQGAAFISKLFNKKENK